MNRQQLRFLAIGTVGLLFAAGTVSAQTQLTREQMAEFLKTAKIVKSRYAGKGVTGSQRATLTDGTVTHDAHITTIDESKSEYKTDRGTELNFRDSYKYNI